MRTSKTVYRGLSPVITAAAMALLLSAPVFAQDNDESGQTLAPAETDVSSEPVPDAEASADSADGESETETETETETDSKRPPDNYRPSEDISEDLGVSFPVDI